MKLLQMVDKPNKTISEKLQLGKSFVDCYFTSVKKKLHKMNYLLKDNLTYGELAKPEVVKHLKETYKFEKDIRQQLLDVMVGGIELDECCIKNTISHGMNKMDRHLDIGWITTYHFLYNEKLSKYGDGGWMKRLTYGGKVNKHFGYCGKHGFFNTPEHNIDKWTLDEYDFDDVISYILFGMMLDCMNKESFHFNWLFFPLAKLYRCENQLEYEYHHPVTGKQVGASLWKPYGKTTKHNKLAVLLLKDLIDEYNNLYSFHPKKMKKVGKSVKDWYSI
jgi:hypothetical protein